MLERELTIEERNSIIKPLFGFEFVTSSPEDNHYYLIDGEGDEFYGSDENCQFDFSTLSGIFKYAIHDAKRRGYNKCQYDLRNSLGI